MPEKSREMTAIPTTNKKNSFYSPFNASTQKYNETNVYFNKKPAETSEAYL